MGRLLACVRRSQRSRARSEESLGGPTSRTCPRGHRSLASEFHFAADSLGRRISLSRTSSFGSFSLTLATRMAGPPTSSCARNLPNDSCRSGSAAVAGCVAQSAAMFRRRRFPRSLRLVDVTPAGWTPGRSISSVPLVRRSWAPRHDEVAASTGWLSDCRDRSCKRHRVLSPPDRASRIACTSELHPDEPAVRSIDGDRRDIDTSRATSSPSKRLLFGRVEFRFRRALRTTTNSPRCCAEPNKTF